MTPTEKAIRDFCGHHADWWPSTTQVQEMLALAQPEKEPLEYWNAVEGWVKIDEVREHFDSVGCGTIYKTAGENRVPVYIAAPPCPTCEALARTVMLDQTSHDTPPLTESMIKAGLAELEAIRQTEFVGDYELVKRLLEAAHGIKETEK
jgi:hypothetical protein